MAHFAEILNGVVQRVIVVHDNELLVDGVETESKGAEFCTNLFGGEWVQTSYNGTIRKQFAGVNFTFNAVNDVFICPQPYSSWVLDDNFDWQAPVARPTEGVWSWNEETTSWVKVD